MASTKERAWLEEYLVDFNATAAARRVGYKNPNKLGPRKKIRFADEISRRLSERAMSGEEVLDRLREQAMGDASDYLTIDHNIVMLDLAKMKADGKTHLIKKYSDTKNGKVIELYDAQAALVHIGRHHGLFVDRKEIELRDLRELTDEELDALIED